MNISDFESPFKKEIDTIRESASFRTIEEIGRRLEEHMRPFQEMQRRMEEVTPTFRDIDYRMKDLTAGLASSVTNQVLASSATAYLASMPSAFDQLKYGTAFEAARGLSGDMVETLRPIIPEPSYREPRDFPVLPMRQRDAELDALKDRIEDLEEEIEDLNAQMNPSAPEPEEDDDPPSTGQYL